MLIASASKEFASNTYVSATPSQYSGAGILSFWCYRSQFLCRRCRRRQLIPTPINKWCELQKTAVSICLHFKMCSRGKGKVSGKSKYECNFEAHPLIWSRSLLESFWLPRMQLYSVFPFWVTLSLNLRKWNYAMHELKLDALPWFPREENVFEICSNEFEFQQWNRFETLPWVLIMATWMGLSLLLRDLLSNFQIKTNRLHVCHSNSIYDFIGPPVSSCQKG